MLGKMFGEIFTGRLNRSSYLAYTSVLAVLIFVFMLYAMSGILANVGEIKDVTDIDGALRKLGDLEQHTSYDMWLAFAVLTYVQANLLIKRLRDTGLPIPLGFGVAMLLYAALPLGLALGLFEVFMLSLVFIPTNAFATPELA